MESWIAFDAAGTLFEPADPVESIYAECFSRLGYDVPEHSWKSAFGKAFRITADPVYSYDQDGEAVEKEWWRLVVRNSAEACGISPDSESMEFAFEELFEHYARGKAWKLFPETEAILASLRSRNIGLVITSNFDSRLRRVLEEMGVGGHFDFILTSADVGARKPSPLILHRFIELTKTTHQSTCLVGDSLHADGGAAETAGIPFFHLDRPKLTLADFTKWYGMR